MKNNNGNLRRGLGIAALLWGSTVSVAAVQGCGPEKETIIEKHYFDGNDPGNSSYTVEDACRAMEKCYNDGFIPDGNGWYEDTTLKQCVDDTNYVIEYAKEKGYMQCVEDAINCWGVEPYPDHCDCYKLEQFPSCQEALDKKTMNKIIALPLSTGPLNKAPLF